VILVVSKNCEGGDLCLEELGIKLKLANGDFDIFPSQKIFHFNMDFKGERASIVFHTEADSESWIKHRNY
jgi:predicted 2-oxoglutarate/Fe(II)-dependent dioxygenase YbiX